MKTIGYVVGGACSAFVFLLMFDAAPPVTEVNFDKRMAGREAMKRPAFSAARVESVITEFALTRALLAAAALPQSLVRTLGKLG